MMRDYAFLNPVADSIFAYAEMLGRTSTEFAPWYVIPGDRKWYRNWVVSTVLVETLERLDPRFPDPPEGLDGFIIE